MPAVRFSPLIPDANFQKRRASSKNQKNSGDFIFTQRVDSTSTRPPRPLAELNVELATNYENGISDPCEIKGESTKTPKSTPAGMGDNEMHFLRTVIANPGKPSSAYAKLAKMYAQKAISLRRWLVKNGYLFLELD